MTKEICKNCERLATKLVKGCYTALDVAAELGQPQLCEVQLGPMRCVACGHTVTVSVGADPQEKNDHGS
jgi:hypothetical protein